MSIVSITKFRVRRVLGCFVLVMFVVATTAMPVLGQETATINGLVVGPSGEVGKGFMVYLKNIGEGNIIAGGPTDASGHYAAQVPVGGRYIIDHVKAPDGTVLPVQSIAPIPIRYAGSTRLDVKFQEPPPKAVTAEPKPEPKPVKTAKSTTPTSGAKKPWYKTPLGITGIVVGAGGVIAAVSGGSSSSPSVSPITAADD
jgi:hypothetical protein